MPIRTLCRFLLIGWSALMAACSALTPYKLPIQQGNIVAAESLTKLKSGMSKNQVVQVLGTPMVNDVFHANRWDYVHYVSKRGTMFDKNHIALIFEDEKLARLVGDNIPALEPMPAIESPAEPGTNEPAEPSESK
jgi:outer membrane protein assembly factor BamE